MHDRLQVALLVCALGHSHFNPVWTISLIRVSRCRNSVNYMGKEVEKTVEGQLHYWAKASTQVSFRIYYPWLQVLFD